MLGVIGSYRLVARAFISEAVMTIKISIVAVDGYRIMLPNSCLEWESNITF